PTGEKLFGRRNFLELLAAFTAPAMVTVMHGRQELGQVDPVSLTARPDQPSVLLLAGRHWLVSSIDWRRRIAWAEPTAGAGKSRWLGSSRALHFDLCRAIQRCLAEGQVPCTLSKRGTTRLATLVEEFSFLDGRAQAIIADEGSIHWWTFAGGRANAALAMTLGHHQCRVRRSDDFSLDLDAPPPTMTAADLGNAMNAADGSDVEREISELKFSACLPLPVARRVVLRRHFDLEGALQVIAANSL
ncbi:MAG: ATP-dependent helicase, partial [Candidatus Zixiibacteriota bacterium]